ncbi:MAG: hypothetical protein K9G64_03125, partial [Bacteroidia bacterium]|nr:hypothetical protein [Bacteroidia bacterium]
MNHKYFVISNLRIVFFVFFLGNNTQTISQTITSTAVGGAWSSTSTWIGGVLPTSTDNVVINGNVVYNLSPTCLNLTINSGDTLYGGASNYTLYVNGNLINNGALLRDPNS